MANGGIIGTVNIPTSTTATGVWQQEEQYEAKVTDTWPQRSLFTTKSLRFNDGSSDNLSRTQESSANSQIFTYSTWVKRSGLTGVKQEMASGGSASTDFDMFYFDTSERLSYYSKTSNSENLDLATNRVFRDLSAWYHIVLSVDTTQGTASNRVKLYVNGVLETSYAVGTYPSVNTNLFLNKASQSQRIGRQAYSALDFFDGYMSETVLIDGQQLAPTSFGVANSDGVWTPIIYSGTYGTNGFNLQFEDAAALGTDSSPNGNTFTVNNLTSIDQSTDYPEVNNATLNPLIYTDSTISEGNLQYTSPGSNPVFGSLSSIGMGQGKWYGEVNYVAGSNHYLVLGVADETFNSSSTSSSYDLGKSGTTSSIAYVVNTGAYRINNSNTSWGSAGGDGQIIMWAIDKVNNKIYFGVNGVWGASSNPASNSGGIPTTALDSSTSWFIGCTNDTGSTETVAQFNFGSPPYAISSGNADANGYGNFEYAVPSGYYALNTANLAEFG
mgnify:CR=1 FL=1